VSQLLAIFQNIGMTEVLVILVVVLLLFGSARLPKLARSLGSSMTEFKKGLRGEGDEESKKIEPAETKPTEESRTPKA
jgi:sec-independent protein translocase protein TatA